MNTVHLVVIAINAMMASGAVLACRFASVNDDPRRRPLWGSIAALSAFYSVGYAWLLMHSDEVLVWSRLFRGVSLITWPLVWILPPILIARQHRADIRAVRRKP